MLRYARALTAVSRKLCHVPLDRPILCSTRITPTAHSSHQFLQPSLRHWGRISFLNRHRVKPQLQFTTTFAAIDTLRRVVGPRSTSTRRECEQLAGGVPSCEVRRLHVGAGRERQPPGSGQRRRGMLDLLWTRLRWAFATWPDAEGWGISLALFAASLLVIVPLAFWANLFSFEHAGASVSVGAKIFFAPCLLEEVIFRALLNPSPREQRPRLEVLLWGIASTIAYVAGHPLNAWLLRPAAMTAFSHPGFLLICTVLGGVCAAAYQRTGSVWPPVLFHWLTVFVWLSLGGRHRAPIV